MELIMVVSSLAQSVFVQWTKSDWIISSNPLIDSKSRQCRLDIYPMNRFHQNFWSSGNNRRQEKSLKKHKTNKRSINFVEFQLHKLNSYECHFRYFVSSLNWNRRKYKTGYRKSVDTTYRLSLGLGLRLRLNCICYIRTRTNSQT